MRVLQCITGYCRNNDYSNLRRKSAAGASPHPPDELPVTPIISHIQSQTPKLAPVATGASSRPPDELRITPIVSHIQSQTPKLAPAATGACHIKSRIPRRTTPPQTHHRPTLTRSLDTSLTSETGTKRLKTSSNRPHDPPIHLKDYVVKCRPKEVRSTRSIPIPTPKTKHASTQTVVPQMIVKSSQRVKGSSEPRMSGLMASDGVPPYNVSMVRMLCGSSLYNVHLYYKDTSYR